LDKRSDATLLKYGVPLINVEEKIIDMEAAKSDLFKKFQWIPHFDRLPFIYGMAITQKK
jgi:hypothetical protein